jgi:hypothetical protein
VVVLPPPQPVLADHPPDLHVHLVVDGVAQLYVLIVDGVTTVRQSAGLKERERNKMRIVGSNPPSRGSRR